MKQQQQRIWRWYAAAAVATAFALTATTAAAGDDDGAGFVYSGRLLAGETGAQGVTSIDFRLYPTAGADAPVWARMLPVTLDAHGAFQVELNDIDGEEIPVSDPLPLLEALRRHDRPVLSLAPNGGEEMVPRQPLRAAPRAVCAEWAKAVPETDNGWTRLETPDLTVSNLTLTGEGTVRDLVLHADAAKDWTSGGGAAWTDAFRSFDMPTAFTNQLTFTLDWQTAGVRSNRVNGTDSGPLFVNTNAVDGFLVILPDGAGGGAGRVLTVPCPAGASFRADELGYPATSEAVAYQLYFLPFANSSP